MRNKKEKIDIYVSQVLSVGSYLAAFLTLVGLILFLFTGQIPGIEGESRPLSFSLFFSGLKEKSPLTFLNLGILVMMLTPLLRVITAGFSFFLEKDYKYVWIASGVFIILLISIILLFT
jgi:uncharacterized membrane protein